MKPLRLLPAQPNLNFIGRRMIFFIISALLVATSAGLYLTKGLNYGIDFKGGILIEVKTPEGTSIGDLRANLSNLGLGEVALQEFGAANDILIRIQRQEGEDQAQQAAIDKVRAALGPGVEYRRTESVGPKVSKELLLDGVLAVLFAMIGILIYVWFRFEWQFGVAAIIALLHDVLATIGIFALTGIEFNLTTVAAVLTIAGYSINDTVVVFDRVRENLRKYKTLPLTELFNNSINETLSRTLMTSGTTLIALLALYLLGGEVIRGFSFGLLWGIVVGTYSSICVAVPLLLYLNINRGSETAAGAAEKEAT